MNRKRKALCLGQDWQLHLCRKCKIFFGAEIEDPHITGNYLPCRIFQGTIWQECGSCGKQYQTERDAEMCCSPRS